MSSSRCWVCAQSSCSRAHRTEADVPGGVALASARRAAGVWRITTGYQIPVATRWWALITPVLHFITMTFAFFSSSPFQSTLFWQMCWKINFLWTVFPWDLWDSWKLLFKGKNCDIVKSGVNDDSMMATKAVSPQLSPDACSSCPTPQRGEVQVPAVSHSRLKHLEVRYCYHHTNAHIGQFVRAAKRHQVQWPWGCSCFLEVKPPSSHCTFEASSLGGQPSTLSWLCLWIFKCDTEPLCVEKRRGLQVDPTAHRWLGLPWRRGGGELPLHPPETFSAVPAENERGEKP